MPAATRDHRVAAERRLATVTNDSDLRRDKEPYRTQRSIGVSVSGWVEGRLIALRLQMICGTCQGARWVCEDHPDRPWGSTHPNGCRCGGAGMPCPVCNNKEGERPAPADFTPRDDRDKGPIR
jgi:hypothetical protein